MSLSDLASLGSFVSNLAATALFMGVQTLPALAESPAPKSKEDIYVVRSVRITRIAPTDFCSQVDPGFGKPTSEGDFLFKSLSVSAADGLVVDANLKTVGRAHACVGAGSDPKAITFFIKGNLGSVKFTGRGECVTDRKDFPEPGINSARCYLNLRDLPDPFVGGLLTTNSILSRQAIGGISDPPGYTQTSIATVRLWRKQK